MTSLSAACRMPWGEIARVVKTTGMVAIVFAHTDVKAWEHLLRALRSANLVVTTSWPMRSERATRMTALLSAVLDSSVVLICRPQSPDREGFYDDVVRCLRIGSPSVLTRLRRWA